MRATKQLKDEHEGILIMLQVIERIIKNLSGEKELDKDEFEKIIEFLRGFVDKCHHGKEEDILFPNMEMAGIPKDNGPIDIMLTEHQIGRGFIKNMSEALKDYSNNVKNNRAELIENGQKYVELLSNHIEKENNILFNMADSVLSDELQNELFEEFEKIETEKIGPGKHEEYHHLIEELEEKYLSKNA
ncbi:MAG: hemerythrin domain-containing protein [Spirochaetes bacterium]|nr:hemerythrin domain-containing protein [Spirochaetota bacterium]